jgi:hypothetical protein
MNKCIKCQSETINEKFCGLSCAASYNNQMYPKRKKGVVYPKDKPGLFLKIKRDPINCKTCEKLFIPSSSNKTYCSIDCHNNYYYHYVEKSRTFLQPGCSGGGCNAAIRKYLVKKHGNKCMICDQSGDNWNGKPMTLIVDHVDGDAYNYSVNNMRLVCPNCDSQLSTYKGRNKGKSTRKYVIRQK